VFLDVSSPFSEAIPYFLCLSNTTARIDLPLWSISRVSILHGLVLTLVQSETVGPLSAGIATLTSRTLLCRDESIAHPPAYDGSSVVQRDTAWNF
jgi:hypothetical protein